MASKVIHQEDDANSPQELLLAPVLTERSGQAPGLPA
jgi:hypothetical protein